MRKNPGNESTGRACVEMPGGDHDVVAAAQKGAPEALPRLVVHFQGYVYALAWRMLRDEQEAEDVVQETFIRIFRHLHRFDFRCRFTTWVFSITLRLCQDRIRASNRHRKKIVRADLVANDLRAGCGHGEEGWIQRDVVEKLEILAVRLPPRQRAVFVLRDLQDQSVGEIARSLHISSASVKSNLCQARRQVRTWFEAMEKGEPA